MIKWHDIHAGIFRISGKDSAVETTSPETGSGAPLASPDSATANATAKPLDLLSKKSTGTKQFLENSVHLFANMYKCDRCCLYLYDDETRTITLKAADGCEMFGKASIVLKLGEGLVGRALAERRPIYTEMASAMRGYVRHHNFPDDELQTFLAIPMLCGKDRVGAVVLQRRTGTPFLAEEISAARLKAAELANSIQNANALILAEDSSSKVPRAEKLVLTEEMTFSGSAVSHGWAMAEVRLFSETSVSALLNQNVTTYPEAKRSLEEAIVIVEKRLNDITKTLDERLPEAASMIFESAIMMMHDESYIGKMNKLIAAGTSVTEAIAKVSGEFISFFQKSSTDYIKEKAHDVEDLALRLLESVTLTSPEENSDTSPHIIISEKLLPSDVLKIAQANVQGIVLVAGGSTAHVTLLVRSLKIPMIIITERDLLRLPEHEAMIMDCANECVIVHPSPKTRKKFEERRNEENRERTFHSNIKKETFTQDGTKISLYANINIIADINSAIDASAEGIGLYRTEFPFIMRQSLPSEAEQQNIYSRILERMPDKPVVFRTLDAGGDKVIPYLFKTKEENPALGLRSIRFSLKYPFILDQQLRAILRAIQTYHRHDVSIMFPMISSLEEFQTAKDHVHSCLESIHAELGDQKIIEPAIGTMIEIPAIVGVIDSIAEISDFFSVGTNDFIQYTLAIDRTNANVSDLYIPHHPAVLKGLKIIADGAIRHNTPLSICGEMGRDPHYIPFLIGIGFRSLSLEPAQISSTQQLISRFTIEQCQQYAKDLLSMDHIADIEKCIDEFASSVFG